MPDKYDEILEGIKKLSEQEPEAPEVPETPETPETPEVPETPEAPETPETPATPETPKDWFEVDDDVSIIKTTEAPKALETPKRDYSSLETDPDFELFLSYKDSGKGLKDLITEFSVTDPSKMSEEQLFNQLCDMQSIPQEERDDEYTQFLTKSRLDRNQILDAVKARIESENQNKVKGLVDSNQKGREQAQLIQNKFTTDVETIATSLKGKTILGLQITDEMSSSIKQDVMNFNIVRQDGTLDTEAITEMVLLKKFIKDIVKVNVTASKNKGKEEILTEIHNPSPRQTSTNTPAPSSILDGINEYINSKN